MLKEYRYLVLMPPGQSLPPYERMQADAFLRGRVKLNQMGFLGGRLLAD
jgi:hypothetical protein